MAIAHILLISTYIVYGNSLFGRDMTRLQSPKRDVTWLHSRRVTPWGKFGPKDLCPINSFITGMRLKIEPKHKGDNSALNAIQLLCTSMYGEEVKNITSATGRFGRYGKIKYCPRGLATGYQLRSQTGQGNARDDVAAVDFKLICSDLNNALSYVTQDDVRSLPWGDWTNKQRCPSKTAVCGISTQVEELGKNLRREDETTLNNVDIACCPTSEPIKNCELKYHWETIRCPTEVVYCKIELTIGIKEDEQLSKFRKFYYKLGNVGEFNEFVLRSLKVQAKNYEEKIFSNYSMKQIISKIDVNRKNSSINVKCEGIVQQFVVTCDLIKLYTYENRCVPDQYAEKGIKTSHSNMTRVRLNV